MGKTSMNVIRRMLLGMNLVSQALLVAEDGKITSDEVMAIAQATFQGMGVEVPLGGVSFVPDGEGGIDIKIPAAVVQKLNFTI